MHLIGFLVLVRYLLLPFKLEVNSVNVGVNTVNGKHNEYRFASQVQFHHNTSKPSTFADA